MSMIRAKRQIVAVVAALVMVAASLEARAEQQATLSLAPLGVPTILGPDLCALASSVSETGPATHYGFWMACQHGTPWVAALWEVGLIPSNLDEDAEGELDEDALGLGGHVGVGARLRLLSIKLSETPMELWGPGLGLALSARFFGSGFMYDGSASTYQMGGSVGIHLELQWGPLFNRFSVRSQAYVEVVPALHGASPWVTESLTEYGLLRFGLQLGLRWSQSSEPLLLGIAALVHTDGDGAGRWADQGTSWMLTVGLTCCEATDRDSDGALDARDRCPDDVEDKDGYEDHDGCPDLDNDRDGLLDGVDRCPAKPEDRDGFEDNDGCPDPDNDRDGVPDAADRCPGAPEDKDGYQDDDGCPDPDNDGDGVVDKRDKCPQVTEDRDGYQDDDGCPDPDNDGDGLPDASDMCPNEAEDKDGHEDEDGCPEADPAPPAADEGDAIDLQ